jgi:hypothetical protein
MRGSRLLFTAAGSESGQRFFKQGVAVCVRSALLDVGQVRFVGLVAVRRGRRTGLLPSRTTTPDAVPQLGNLRVFRERPRCLVGVGAVKHNRSMRSGRAAVTFAHRSRTDPAAPNCTTACHSQPFLSRSTGRFLLGLIEQAEPDNADCPDHAGDNRQPVEVALHH